MSGMTARSTVHLSALAGNIDGCPTMACESNGIRNCRIHTLTPNMDEVKLCCTSAAFERLLRRNVQYSGRI